MGSTVPISLDLDDVRTLVFPLNSPTSTIFLIPWKRIIINFHLPRRIKLEPPLLNSSLYMLPEDSAFISGMRTSVIEFAELLVLQPIRGQHDMTIGQLDLPLLKQEIEELV